MSRLFNPGWRRCSTFLSCARKTRMIDLLLQAGYILVVLAVISLFVCTLPVWLIVLVAVLLLR